MILFSSGVVTAKKGMSEFTVVIRHRNRHVFEYVRDMTQPWSRMVASALPLLGVVNEQLSWSLFIQVGDDEYVTVPADERVGATIGRMQSCVRAQGRVEAIVEFCDSNGVLPSRPSGVAPICFVPSDTPVQLPKALIDFIDHLRPASQVS